MSSETRMNNSTTNSTSLTTNSNYRSQLTIIVQVTSIAILGVIIVLGNLAIILTFIKTPSLLRQRCFNLLISLSVADFLVGVVDFIDVYYFYSPETVTRKFLKSLGFLGILSGTASILTLASISLERFIATVFPFRYRHLGWRVYAILIALPWMIALVISSFYVFDILYIVYRYFRVIFPIFAVLIILLIYTGIAIKIRLSKMSTRNENRRKRNQRLIVTLLIITLASLICWLPLQLFQIIRYFCHSCPKAHINLFYLMIFLQCCNSGINIFIYLLRMPEFRKACSAIFCPRRGRITQSSVVPSLNKSAFEDEKNSQGTKTGEDNHSFSMADCRNNESSSYQGSQERKESSIDVLATLPNFSQCSIPKIQITACLHDHDVS